MKISSKLCPFKIKHDTTDANGKTVSVIYKLTDKECGGYKSGSNKCTYLLKVKKAVNEIECRLENEKLLKKLFE